MDKPKVVNHMIATCLLSTGSAVIYAGTVTAAAQGLVAGAILLGPMSWWLYKTAKINANTRPANIFYENGVTQDEIERIQHIDAMECVAFEMQSLPGYGLVSRNQSHM